MRRVALLLVVSLVLFVVVGCESTEEDKPTYDELIGFGKKYLEQQDAVAAAEAFEAALKLRPDGVDAKYGLFLANIMQVTNLFSNLLDLIDEAEGLDTFGTSDQPFGTYLQEFLQKVLEPKLTRNEELFLELASEEELLFTLDSYKLVIGEDVLFDWHGRFKQPELHLLGAVNALILAIDHMANSYYLDFDPTKIEEMPPLSDDLFETAGALLEFIEDLMNDSHYPHFLELKGDEGAVRMPAAGLLLGAAWFRIIESFELASSQEGDRLDDPITYKDLNGNGTRDPEEPLIIHGVPLIAELLGSINELPPDQIGEDAELEGQLVELLEDLLSVFGAAFLDTSPYDIFPEESNPITLADLQPLLVYFGILPFPLPFMDRFGVEPGPFFYSPETDGMRELIRELIRAYDFLDLLHDLGLF